MAMTPTRALKPKYPRFADLDYEKFALDLDRLSDTLYWDFYVGSPSAVSYLVSDHILLSVDPVTEEVVGLQLDAFLTSVIHGIPELLELADQIGLTPGEVEEARARISPGERRQAVLRSILNSIVHSEPDAVAV